MTLSISSVNKAAVLAMVILAASSFKAEAAALTSVSAAALPNLPCSIDEQLQAVNSATQNQADNQSSVIRELNARKALLTAISGCILDELKDLDSKINSTDSSTQEIQAFKNWVLEQLDTSINYYEYQSAQIGDLGIQGSKIMARNWRERRKADLPIKQLGADYVIWSQNQKLFETAGNRFDEIKKLVLSLGFPEDSGIMKKLSEAADSLDAARASNGGVWGFLKENDQDSASIAIKDSLEKLADTYKIFFEISDMTKQILPLPR